MEEGATLRSKTDFANIFRDYRDSLLKPKVDAFSYFYPFKAFGVTVGFSHPLCMCHRPQKLGNKIEKGTSAQNPTAFMKQQVISKQSFHNLYTIYYLFPIV